MTFLRTLRLLILGETWTLPLGVALVLGVAFVGRELDAELWRDAGGPFLLLAIVAVLLVGLARGGRRR